MITANKSIIVLLLFLFLAPTQTSAQELGTPRDVLTANIEATGGAAAWASARSIHTVSESVVETPMGAMISSLESWILSEGYLLNISRMIAAPPGFPEGAGDSKMYLTPDGGWMESMNGRQSLDELPGNMAAMLRSTTGLKEEIGLLQSPDSLITLLPSEEIEGSMAYVVEVKGESPSKRYYDHGSLLMVGVSRTIPGVGKTMSFAKDYRDVNGFQISFLQEASLGDIGTQSVILKSAEINIDLTPEMLAELANN